MMREEVLILHTNDIHSHLENWPKVRRFIKNQQKQARRQGVQTLKFDIGDAIDRQHPLTEVSAGQANIKLLNELSYDGVTVGNNEMLGLTHSQLNQLYDHANFPVLIANVLDKQTQTIPSWAQPYEIITTTAGQKIAVFAMTAPFERTFPLLDWQPLDVEATLESLLPELKAQADTIVLLSHLGLPTDRQLADKYDELDLIMGAHTHHVLPDGEWHGHTLVTAAGRYGSHVGTIHLTLEHGRIIQADAKAIPTETMPTLPDDQVEIEGYMQQGERKLSQQVVATLPENYVTGSYGSKRLIDLGLAALQELMPSDVAMLSTGMFLDDLPKGPVTSKALHDILPHAIHPMQTTLPGHELERLIKEITKNQPSLLNYQIKGMGFRGHHQSFGQIVWSGLTIDDNQQIWINGAPLNSYRQYTIANLDHYLFIQFFPTIEIAGQNDMNYDYVLREVLAKYLQKHFN